MWTKYPSYLPSSLWRWDTFYPIYKVRDNHQIITKAAYVVLGINLDGYKEILGIWIGENESSKFWLGVLNQLKSRGVKEVYLFCVDVIFLIITFYAPILIKLLAFFENSSYK